MIILRKGIFSETYQVPRRLRGSKTFLGRIFRDDLVECRRARLYNKERGASWFRPVWRFSKNFQNWQQERFGDIVGPWWYSI